MVLQSTGCCGICEDFTVGCGQADLRKVRTPWFGTEEGQNPWVGMRHPLIQELPEPEELSDVQTEGMIMKLRFAVIQYGTSPI